MSLRSKTLRSAVALAGTVALLATGCGGGSDSGGGAKKILRVGTTYYIDTLNPFVGIETQDSTAYGMVFPQLVQYGPGLKLVGDWAKSWTHTPDGLVWTFHLHGGGKWSDGVPLTAKDAVWTIDTSLRYANGATSYFAGILAGVKSASAPNANTLVLRYSRPVAPALANLEQFFILPEHVWSKHLANNGGALKAFRPEQHLPMVSGGPYTISQFQEKGTTVFKPNPVLLRAQVARSRCHADVLHQRDLDGRRPAGAQPRLRRRRPLYRRERAQGPEGHHPERAARQRGHQPGLQLQPQEAEEPRAPESAGEGGVRVRHAARADRERRVPRLRQAVGEHHLAMVDGVGLDQPGREAAAVRPGRRPTRSSTRWATRAARAASAPSPPRRAPTHSRPTR